MWAKDAIQYKEKASNIGHVVLSNQPVQEVVHFKYWDLTFIKNKALEFSKKGNQSISINPMWLAPVRAINPSSCMDRIIFKNREGKPPFSKIHVQSIAQAAYQPTVVSDDPGEPPCQFHVVALIPSAWC